MGPERSISPTDEVPESGKMGLGTVESGRFRASNSGCFAVKYHVAEATLPEMDQNYRLHI